MSDDGVPPGTLEAVPPCSSGLGEQGRRLDHTLVRRALRSRRPWECYLPTWGWNTVADHDRRSNPGRRIDDSASDRVHEEIERARIATRRARHAEDAAIEERRHLETERAAYRSAREQDEKQAWERDGGDASRTRFRRNDPEHRRDLYESEFTDYEHMTTRRRHDEAI